MSTCLSQTLYPHMSKHAGREHWIVVVQLPQRIQVELRLPTAYFVCSSEGSSSVVLVYHLAKSSTTTNDGRLGVDGMMRTEGWGDGEMGEGQGEGGADPILVPLLTNFVKHFLFAGCCLLFETRDFFPSKKRAMSLTQSCWRYVHNVCIK